MVTSLLRTTCFLLTLSLSSQNDRWPFGPEPASGPSMQKRDLYNLGVLGAKASDEIEGEPQPAGTGRRQVQSTPQDSAQDVGPERLKIEILYPEGPATRAGLQLGDVLVGAGGKNFKKGSFEPLARALEKALATDGNATLKLDVERDGKVLKLEAEIEGLGKTLKKPTSDAARAQLGRRALDWLAARQREDGGFPQTLSGQNGSVVQACVAGLAWIAGGSDLEDGPHADNVRRARRFVVENVGATSAVRPEGGANWNQENWGWVHAGIFLGELHAHSPSPELETDLDKVVAGIQAGRETSGGYAHGPGGPNALGYVELNIVSGLALCGLGLAQRAGRSIDEDGIDAMMEYLEASSSGGGVGYSTKDGQVGQGNIGRSAVTWLGYRNVGRGKSKMAGQMAGYVKRNAGEVLGGHASLMQHVLLAGVAAQAQGGGAEKNFWSSLRRDMVLALAPDGSFQPRPWHETLSMASNSDVSFGEVWTTASWAIVLLCKPTGDVRGLPAWMAP